MIKRDCSSALHSHAPPPRLTASWQALSFAGSSPSGPPPSLPVLVHCWGSVEATPADSLWLPVTGAEIKRCRSITVSAPSILCTSW